MSNSLRADAAGDQIAMQLGAIQLGYRTPYSPSASDLTNGIAASILKQGQLVQTVTTANYATTAYVVNPGTTNPTVVPNPQTSLYRSQYLSAVQNALANPTTATIPKQTVNTYNPVTKKFVPVANVTGALSPASTTPTLILQAVVADMPNFAPTIVSNAVAATMAGTNGNNGIFYPTWGAVPWHNRPTALFCETALTLLLCTRTLSITATPIPWPHFPALVIQRTLPTCQTLARPRSVKKG